jgi:hypothetical protein
MTGLAATSRQIVLPALVLRLSRFESYRRGERRRSLNFHSEFDALRIGIKRQSIQCGVGASLLEVSAGS